MKKIFTILAVFILHFMLVAYANEENNRNIIFLSGDENDDSPDIYMLLTDESGQVVEKINDRNEKLGDASAYEAVLLSSPSFGFVTEENNSVRGMISVYQLEDNKVLAVRNEAVGAAGPNHPRSENDFRIFEYSAENGFVEQLHAKKVDHYDNYADSVYELTESLFYVNDDMVAIKEFFYQLKEYGIGLKEITIETSELNSTPQPYTIEIPDDDARLIFAMAERNSEIPESIYSYLGLVKSEVSGTDTAVDKASDELAYTDEELAEAVKIEEQKQKERKAAEKEAKKEALKDGKVLIGDGMTFKECLIRFFVALAVLAFTCLSLFVVFLNPFITMAVDMVVIFIGMALIGGDRLMNWLKLDLQSILVLFGLFFGAILVCSFFEWSRIAGLVYLAQMILLCLAISGVVSSEVMNVWVTNVGLFVGIPAGVIMTLFLLIFVGGPAAVLYAIISIM